MNITLFTDIEEAVAAADNWTDKTGVDHLVIERFPAGPFDTDVLGLGRIAAAAHRYTVLSKAEWAQVAHEWNATLYMQGEKT